MTEPIIDAPPACQSTRRRRHHPSPVALLASAQTLQLVWFGFIVGGAFAGFAVSAWWLLLPAAMAGWAAASARQHGDKRSYRDARFCGVSTLGLLIGMQAVEDLFGNCI
jgi:hypothetical protein